MAGKQVPVPDTTAPVNSGGAPASDAGAASASTANAAGGGGNWWDGFWSGLFGGATGNVTTPGGSDPFSGLWSGIAAGFEGGIVAILTDLWKLVEGPVEIFIGFTLLLTAAFLLFKDDILMAARIGAAFM